MHIYLALANRQIFSLWLSDAQPRKQKSFSLESKDFYLLWAQGQDAIELIPTIGYFNLYRPCPCCLVTGSLSASQKTPPCQHPPFLLAPPAASQRQPMFRDKALLIPTTIQWDQPTPLLDSGLQQNPATLLHWCQAPCVWWVAGCIRMEMRAAPNWDPLHWCSPTSTGCSGTLLHPLLTHQQKGVPSAWCFEWAKALPTATMHK